MEVGNGHPGRRSHVEGQPVAVLLNLLPPRQLYGGLKEVSQQWAVRCRELGGVPDVLARNDQHVHGCAWVDIADGEDVMCG